MTKWMVKKWKVLLCSGVVLVAGCFVVDKELIACFMSNKSIHEHFLKGEPSYKAFLSVLEAWNGRDIAKTVAFFDESMWKSEVDEAGEIWLVHKTGTRIRYDRGTSWESYVAWNCIQFKERRVCGQDMVLFQATGTMFQLRKTGGNWRVCGLSEKDGAYSETLYWP